MKKNNSCLLPNFSNNNKISISIVSDDTADSIVQKILDTEWGFAIDKDNSQIKEEWNSSIDQFLIRIDNQLKRKQVDTQIREEVQKKLSSALLIDKTKSTDSEEDLEAVIPQAELDTKKQKHEVALNQQLQIVFGQDRNLMDIFKNQFKHEMYSNMIIHIGKSVLSSYLVTDVKDLNKAVQSFLEYQYSVVYQFLKNNDLVKHKVATLYDGDGNLRPLADENLNAFQEYLNSQPDVQKLVSEDYFNKDKQLYNVVKAFLSLEYFNELLKSAVHDYIYIDEKRNQPITKDNNRTWYKYMINKKNVNQASGWHDQVRDGLSEMGSFSQTIMEQIPMVDRHNTYLSKTSVLFACLKFRSAINNLGEASSLTGIVKLREAFSEFSKSTVESWKSALTTLHQYGKDENSELRKALIQASEAFGHEKIGLTENDFDVLESIYQYFFDTNNGVHFIENKHLQDGKKIGYSLVNTFFGAINATTQSSYMEVSQKDGRATLRLKPKWGNRQKVFSLYNAINDKIIRENDSKFLGNIELLKDGNIKYLNYTIKVTNDSLGILVKESDLIRLKVLDQSGETIVLDEVFDDAIKGLVSDSERQKILTDEKYNDFRSLIFEIDNKLKTHFLSETGLQQLRLTLQQIKKKNALQALYLASAKIATAYYINDSFKKNKGDELSTFDIVKYLQNDNPTVYLGLQKFLNKNSNIFITKPNGVYIEGIEKGSEILNAISDAEAIFNGDNNKSVTRNMEGKNMPNISVQYTDIVQEFQKQPDNSASSLLLFSGRRQSTYIVDTYLDMDVETPYGTKQVNSLTPQELLYHNIVNKFLLGLADTGLFVGQPVTYSDKKKFLNFAVNWKDIPEYKDYAIKGIALNIPKEVHIQLMYDTIGNYYKEVFHNVCNDYRKIFNIAGNDLQVFMQANQLMKSYTLEQFTQKAHEAGVTELFEDLHYRTNKKRVTVQTNELLLNYVAQIFRSIEDLENFLYKEKIYFLNQLLETYISFPVDGFIRKQLENALVNKKESAEDWIEDDYLVLAKVGDRNILYGEEIPVNASNVQLNPLLESYFYMSNVLNNNLKLGLIGHELNHPIKTLNKYLDNFNKKFGTSFTDFVEIEQELQTNPNEDYREELENIYHELMSTAQSTQFKRTVPIPGTIRLFDQQHINGIASTYKVAIIEDIKAEVHDFIGDYGFAKSDTIDAHDGSIWIDPFTSILENNSMDDSRVGDVKKPLWDVSEDTYGVRRLIKCASNAISNRIMLQSSWGSLNMYKMFKKMTNIETFDDIDLINDWAISEYDADTSFSSLIAPDGLYYHENGKYHQIVNFGKEEINGERVYFTEERDTNNIGTLLNKGQSYKVYHYFDENSNHIKVREGETIPQNAHTIRTLFELHASMGGIESMSKLDKKLVYSEASNQAVANFMIYVSVPTDEYYSKIKQKQPKEISTTQKYYHQPLKTRLINALINQSAIKNGASNVNKKHVWEDDTQLLYSIMSTEKYGIQQDSDHEADEGTVSEMTQVISALDATGLYHDEVAAVYKALAQQTLKAAEIEIETIVNADNPNALYELIGKTILNNYKDTKGLTRAILHQVKKNFKFSANHSADDLKIPFSDPNIYSKILQLLGNVLNKKSIKRKYPGMGQVMVPGFGIYQIIEINGIKYQYLDILKRAVKYNNTLKENSITTEGKSQEAFNKEIVDQYLNTVIPNEVVWDKESGLDNLYKIDPTDSVDIKYLNKDGEEAIKTVSLNSLKNYYSFKENPEQFLLEEYKISGIITTIEKNRKVPRDLASARIHITYLDNNNVEHNINIFDTWPYEDLIKLYKQLETAQDDFTKEDIQLQIDHIKKNVIPQFFQKLEDGKIMLFDENSEPYEGKVTKLKKQAAEVIMSNVYKTRLGIRDGDEMADILENPKYFQTIVNPISGIKYQYDFQFVAKDSENSVYISLDPISETNEEYRVKFKHWKPTNYHRERELSKNTKIINRVYYMSDSNIKQFEIGRDIDVSDELYWDADTKSFKYKKDDQVETERNLFVDPESGKVLEYIEFVVKSEIKPKAGKSFIKYNVDRKALSKVLLPNEKQSNALSNIISDLYRSDSFLLITPANEIKKENYNDVLNTVKHLSYKYKETELGWFLHSIISKVFTFGKNTIDKSDYIYLNMGNTAQLNSEIEALGIDRQGKTGQALLNSLLLIQQRQPELKDKIKEIKDRYLESSINYYRENLLSKLADKQMISFEKSRYFVSSRIPAQTLQSFMQMECVGFNGVDTNQCAVSHFQTFLQGSDYDIDKSYMLGLNFDKGGIYLGWSDLFDYSSLDTLEASEELPLPSGKKYRYLSEQANEEIKKNYIDISLQARAIVTENNPVTRIKLLARLLKRLNKRNEFIIRISEFSEEDAKSFIDLYLNKHEQTQFGQQSDSILKNFIASNIQRLIQKTGNIPDAYAPVVMDALQDTKKDAPKQKSSTKLTLYNPSMVPVFQEVNMTGKSGTGIAANGQKGLFMWRFDTLDVLQNKQDEKDFVIFNTTIDRVLGRKSLNPKSVTLNSLPYMNWVTSGLNTLNPKLKPDNIGSQYISAATDNAKELILAIINANSDFMRCHLYLMSLGFDVEDIVAFMTSPAVSAIASFSKSNIFIGSDVKLSDIIDFSLTYLQNIKLYTEKSLNPPTDKKQIAEHQTFLKELEQNLETANIRGADYIANKAYKETLQRIPSLEEAIDDIISLKNIIQGADEFTTLARLLSINQGIPQTKEDLSAFKNKIRFALNKRIKDVKLLNNDGIPNNKNIILKYFYNKVIDGKKITFIEKDINGKFDINKKSASEYYGKDLNKSDVSNILIDEFINYFGDVIKFEPDTWLSDINYRKRTAEFYNVIKHTINIFHVINNVEHFKAMFDIANILNQADKKVSLKSKLSNHYNELLRQEFPYAPDNYENLLLSSLDEVLVGHYLKQAGIRIPLKESWKGLDSKYNIRNISVLQLQSDYDIASFKYIFETYIIPELQQGTFLEDSQENAQLKNNEFIQGLLLTEDKGVPLYKADIDLIAKDTNESIRKQYFTYLKSMNALSNYTYQGIPLSDLFMLYNLIINKNKYGAERLTELFEDFILNNHSVNNSFIYQYLQTLGELDYPTTNDSETLESLKESITLYDLLYKVAPIVTGRISKTRKEPIIKYFSEEHGYQYIQYKNQKYDFSNPVDFLIKSPTETVQDYIERQVRCNEYGFGLVYSQYINGVKKDLMSEHYLPTFESLIESMIINYSSKCE